MSASAKVNPYDPQSETLDPIIVSAEAAVESGFVDRVVMLDPTMAPGAPIRFRVQPLQTVGRMDVNPANANGAGGSALFLINFALQNVLGGSDAPFVLSYEKIILSGTAAESTWNTSGLTSLSGLAGGPITVPNGSIWDVSFSIRAAVQALPGMLPAFNPQGALSEAQFMNTVHWGGIADVVDAQGNPLSGFSMQSELGFDWISPIPEPSQAVLLLTGLVVVVAGQFQRRRHAVSAHPDARAAATE